jgi:hypothetical protein
VGSMTEFSIDGYPLLETKSYAVDEVLAIFRESDKRVFDRKVSERNPMVWGTPSPGDDEFEAVILYQSTAKKIAQRLDIMGFTLARAKQDFELALREKLLDIPPPEEGEEDVFEKDREQFEKITFEDYAENLRSIISRRIPKAPLGENERADLSDTEKYIVEANYYQEDLLMGFFCSDTRFLIRLACSVVAPDAIVEQDLTEVVHAGYYEFEDPISDNANEALTGDYPANAKIILLTEGSSDAAILREALSVLYPHLVEFYSFFDFDASRAAGGASQLVSVIKAFIAAGISNRVVALFDNDTAGREAVRGLRRVQLPGTVALLHYPNLKRLRSYPTIGPTGTAAFDVNGLAGSIELYLGEDVIASTGKECPVQWRGFSEGMGAYQGEVMHKSALQDAFWERAARSRSDPQVRAAADWSGLDAIWQLIFHAFDNVPWER